MQKKIDAGPWWKEPWPWFLMAGPAVAIVACIVTIVIAFKHADEPIIRDVVKRGLVVQQAAPGQPAADRQTP